MEASGRYAAVALEAINASAVPQLLDVTELAVVVERLASGGGATRWYLLRSRDDLDALAFLVRPGSCISFCFDDRMRVGTIDEAARFELIEIARRDFEAVIAAQRSWGIELDVDFVAAAGELDAFLTEHRSEVYVYGAFPGRDNDGERAVTLDLPDEDGTVRRHPH